MGDDTIDTLAKRGAFPFDRRKATSFRIEKDRGNLAPGCAIKVAVQRAKLKRQSCAMEYCELQALQYWAASLTRETPPQTLQTVQSCFNIYVTGDQETDPARCKRVSEPKLMIAVRVTEENVLPVACSYICEDRCEIVGVEGLGGDRLRRGRNDNCGWNVLWQPECRRDPSGAIGRMRERSSPSGERVAPFRFPDQAPRSRYGLMYFDNRPCSADYAVGILVRTVID